MFKVVPECEGKQRLLTLMSKFDKLRKIYREPNTTLEQRQNYNDLALDFHRYMKSKLPWIHNTSIVHQLCFHFGSYFNNTGGTYSLIDLSSSGLELGLRNKIIQYINEHVLGNK